MRVRAALVTSIYRKALRMSPSERQERTVGEVVTLMSVDATRLQDLFPYVLLVMLVGETALFLVM